MDPHALTQHERAQAGRNPKTEIELPSTAAWLFAVGLSRHAISGAADDNSSPSTAWRPPPQP
jgi:hypothetical protein